MLACSPDMSGGNPSGGREDPPHTPTSLLNNLAWIPPTNTVEEPPTSSVLGSTPIRGSAPPIRGLAQPHPPGPSDFPGFIRSAHHRPPFFIREIYKNGFLKRLPYNEKKSSALAKLMKSDRFWVVFSIHDDIHPFLELWHEPTEVASKPPVYIFPLVACQHISPSIIPADQEWSFVINFDTVAIRFSCNSREVMDDWVEVIRNKLGEMGILNPKGNLYSKVPLGPPVTKPVIRDPTSPLPQPPARPLTVSLPESESGSSIPKLETIMPPQTKSVIETSNGENPSFTTSIYLNQTPESSTQTTKTPNTSLIVNRKSSLPQNAITKTKVTGKSISLSQSLADVTISAQGTEKGSGTGTSSVYLNQSSPTRHVTVIPINSQDDEDKEGAVKQEETEGVNVEFVEYENHTYGAIFDFEDKIAGTDKIVLDTSKPVVSHESSPKRRDKSPKQQDRNYDSNPKILDNTMQKDNTSRNASSPRRKASSPYKRESSPRKKESSPKRKDSSPRRKDSSPRRRDSSPRRSREKQREGYYSSRERLRDEPPPLPHRPVLRRLSERRQEVYEDKVNIKKKIRKKSQRSSSLGPLLDSNQLGGTEIGASTHSLESVESNPRQAVPKSDRGLGAIPRRPLPLAPRYEDQGGHPLLTSPTRALAELPPGVRPPSYHPLLGLGSATPGSGKGFPPMVPLPGLTCQLSALPGAAGSIPQPAPEERTWNQEDRRSLREQQVLRLRQELAHPGGVRLILRKKDVQSSLALVDMFGCVWVAGWKQKEYPVLINAFHMGDQILSVSGVIIRRSEEFSKLVKLKPADLHTEIIIRRFPFSQIYLLKPEIEGQSLGILNYNNTPEIREIVPGSVAAAAGILPKVRSFDGQTAVALVVTELNGRPVNLFSRDGECWERIQACARDNREISIILQPADILHRIRKQFKNIRGYKEYILS